MLGFVSKCAMAALAHDLPNALVVLCDGGGHYQITPGKRERDRETETHRQIDI